MLHLASKVRGASIHALDGDIGTVEDFYFEQEHWAIRYLLVDTGKWLPGRRVLLSPQAVSGSWSMTRIAVQLTKEQVRNSPKVDVLQPLTRLTEVELLGYYGHPIYWREPAADAIDPEAQQLRSTRNITGYHIKAVDGELGHVDDFLIGEQSWRIRFLRVDTSNWLGGRSVIISADVLQWTDRSTGTLHVTMTRDEVAHSPAFSSIESELNAQEIGPPFVIL